MDSSKVQGAIFTVALVGVGIGTGAWIHWGAGVLASCAIALALIVWDLSRGGKAQ